MLVKHTILKLYDLLSVIRTELRTLIETRTKTKENVLEPNESSIHGGCSIYPANEGLT